MSSSAVKIFKASPEKHLKFMNQIPDEILQDEKLNSTIKALLPSNYKFEIHKTVWQLRKYSSKRVALQFPEGLLMYSCIISDILEEFTDAETVIMGDVTYGACCIDDYTARALGCDFMVHYGHSCLVPIDVTEIRTLYVFVEIAIDLDHFIRCVEDNFEIGQCGGPQITLVSTVQFISSLQMAKKELEQKGFRNLVIPQAKPLSSGEILGCTSPKISRCSSNQCNGEGQCDTETTSAVPERSLLIYLGDGRFHLESIMIANPELEAYRYDPYSQIFSQEFYETEKMKSIRSKAIEQARSASCYGLILGTLGRQGNPKVLDQLEKYVQETGKSLVKVLLSEIFPQKLELLGGESGIGAWVQVACPRLSIDWGHFFKQPLLSPYEAAVLFQKVEWQSTYPMDFYARDSLGPWTPNHPSNQDQKSKLKSGIKFSDWKKQLKQQSSDK